MGRFEGALMDDRDIGEILWNLICNGGEHGGMNADQGRAFRAFVAHHCETNERAAELIAQNRAAAGEWYSTAAEWLEGINIQLASADWVPKNSP
jgi:hypothetical protein